MSPAPLVPVTSAGGLEGRHGAQFSCTIIPTLPSSPSVISPMRHPLSVMKDTSIYRASPDMGVSIIMWSTPVHLYCERMAVGFWAEPVNAATNVAFLVTAFCAFARWRRAGGTDDG